LPAARLLALIGLTLALAYLIFLAGAYLRGDFLIDPQGRPIANDFVNVFAAGRLALENDPAAAYDWTVHKAAEVRAVGHDFANYYGWHYPPTFLFVAAALALPPCLAASAAWLLLTLAAYAAIVGRIVGTRAGGWFALGFPAAFWNVTAGQNSFLTAALIGGTLALLERHPTLAGVCLGLLSYKPQFGLLFPVVLIADRRWRTLAVAAAVAIALAALSLVAFGSASWQAFMQWLPVTGRVVAGRRRRRFQPAAEPVRTGARARRQRNAGLDGAGRRRRCARRISHLAVVQPRAVRSESRRARRRCASRHAVSLYLRPRRAFGRRRVSSPLRAAARLHRR